MTAKIAAAICVYGDPDGLDRCLYSLALQKGGLDGAIIIHTRFEGFDTEFADSLEQTLSVTKKYANVFVDSSHDILNQIKARNLYLEHAAKQGYNWVFVIDSDEYVARNADWPEFRRQLEFVDSLGLDHQVFDVKFEGPISETGPRPRLLKNPGSITYWIKHYWFVLKDKHILLKGHGDAGRMIGGIFVLHGKFIRTQEHQTASILYNKWQEFAEAVPRP